MAGTQERLGDEGNARARGMGPCAWCAEPATKRLEVEPAIKSTSRYGKPIERRHAITAPACKRHFEHFENQKATALDAKRGRR